MALSEAEELELLELEKEQAHAVKPPSAAAPAQQEGFGRSLVRSSLEALPVAGGLAGGTIGGLGTVEALGAGAIPGAALGYAGGKQLERLGKQYLLGDTADNVPTAPLEQATQVVGDLGEGAAFEMGGQVAGKAIEGVAKTPVGKRVSDVGQYISDRLASGAEKLSAFAQGAGKTEFKNGTAKQLGRYGLDNRIVTPLANTEAMLERAAAAKEAAGKSMGNVYSQIDEAGAAGFNPTNAARQIEEELSPTYRTAINKAESTQLDNTIESVLARGDGNIPLSEAQALKEEIGSVAFPKGKRPIDPSPKQQMAADAYSIINKTIDDAATEGAKNLGNPELATQLTKGKADYGMGTLSEKLLADKSAGEQAGTGIKKVLGKVADAHLIAAAPFTGGSSLKVLAAKKGVEAVGKYGNQTGAVVLDKSSKAMQSLMGSNLFSEGQLARLAASPYFRALKNAGDVGGAEAVATTHYVLQQTDPEYQQFLKDEQK
jgi:hypothetical protein